jgi:hypothetical protein
MDIDEHEYEYWTWVQDWMNIFSQINFVEKIKNEEMN